MLNFPLHRLVSVELITAETACTFGDFSRPAIIDPDDDDICCADYFDIPEYADFDYPAYVAQLPAFGLMLAGANETAYLLQFVRTPCQRSQTAI